MWPTPLLPLEIFPHQNWSTASMILYLPFASMTVSAATFKVFNVMKQITHHINIILICLNVLGLTTFCHFQSENDFSLTFLFPFFFALLWPSSNPLILRSLFCIVALLSLVAVFIPYKFISILIASCSLGLALNIGYQLTNQIQ